MNGLGEEIKKNISKNIVKYREKAHLSQKELAKKLNTTPSRVSNWEQGSNCPTIDILFEVCKILNVSINDIYGVYPESDMTLTFDEQQHIKKYRALTETSRQHVDTVLAWESEHSKELDYLSKQNNFGCRVYTYMGKIACAGTGFYYDEIPTNTIKAPYCKGADFIIGVNGDSMEPDYHDGDRLYIEKVERLDIGEVGIFTMGNECYIKELGKTGLISKNPNYQNINGNGDIRLIGKVLGKVE